MKWLVLTGTLLTIAFPLHSQELSAEDIVARHLEARGGAQRLRALETVIYRNGLYREGSYVGSGRAFMAMARPYFKIVSNQTDSTASFREGYDGSAWEWYGSPGIVNRGRGELLVEEATTHIEERRYMDALITTRKALYLAVETEYDIARWKDYDSAQPATSFKHLMSNKAPYYRAKQTVDQRSRFESSRLPPTRYRRRRNRDDGTRN